MYKDSIQDQPKPMLSAPNAMSFVLVPEKSGQLSRKPDLTILDLRWETFYTYDVIATILNVADFPF